MTGTSSTEIVTLTRHHICIADTRLNSGETHSLISHIPHALKDKLSAKPLIKRDHKQTCNSVSGHWGREQVNNLQSQM